MKSQPPILNTSLGRFGLVILAIIVIGGGIGGWYYYQGVAKFTPIDKLPPTSEYNLTDAGNKAAYDRLQKAYTDLDKFKGQNLQIAQIIDPAISRANAFMDLGDTGRAILSYEWLNKYRPNGLQGFNNLANLYVKIGEYDKAEKNYLIAIANTKGLHTDPYEGLFDLYQGHLKDKWPQIESILLGGIAQATAQGQPVLINFHNLLAQYYESVGRTGDAITQYKIILTDNPHDAAIQAKIKELEGKV